MGGTVREEVNEGEANPLRGGKGEEREGRICEVNEENVGLKEGKGKKDGKVK